MLRLIHGDALTNILDLYDKGERFEAVLTDPPYCSRIAGIGLNKYYEGCTLEHPQYSCENLSPNAFLVNTRLWMQSAARLLVNGGYFFCFSDYRQIPFFSSCIEMAGLDYRGIVVWDKKNARPQIGQFTQMAEFVVWGTKGKPLSTKIKKGIITASSVPSKKRLHPCQKPDSLLDEILSILPDGSRVLDPFSGCGSTGAAAQRLGLDFTGVELSDYYFDVMQKNLKSC